ncbi:MAG: MBL fold metallo-hydrolase [Chloroflexi bacterium]|nr:MBL fold metallo-hydrolase [Chloroflexota bacterium]
MQINLSFLGAAQNVTGSKYLVEADGTRVLVDCGLYQEWALKSRNWDPFPVPPQSLDAVLLTHAHLDHCGYVPKLARDGFHNRVYCTAATSEIAQIILLDSAHLMEEDAEFKRKRHERERRKGPYDDIPLYTTNDARDSFGLLTPKKYGESIRIGRNAQASLHDVGHVLGSSAVRLEIRKNGATRSILFSGDVGRGSRPILRHPAPLPDADYVVVESTYGDRTHQDAKDVEDMLADVINSTKKAGGNIVIPTFALERSQELLYFLDKLLIEDRIPHLMVFVDSPMATSITQVFERHPELLNGEMTRLLRRKESPFSFPGLKMVGTVDESKAINHISGTVVIMAGSGMCTGGRIKHHLVNNIGRPESTILFVGYQAVGTLGRQIVDGAKEVRILGQMHRVRARVVQINGFSAHADRDELYAWLTSFPQAPRHVFVTHGDEETAKSFANFVRERTGWKTEVPAYMDKVVLQ